MVVHNGHSGALSDGTKGDGGGSDRKNLDGRNTKTIPTDDLMELAKLVLDNNEFEFEGEYFIQKEGTAIGSKLGKNYACTYMRKK